MRDDELQRDVTAELSWDPQVDSDAIKVSVANGTVALRGTAGSLWLKQAGGRVAARVRGVTRISNELRVEIAGKDRRDDEDLRGDVLEALMLDVSVPTTLDAQARDGFVTLTGAAQRHYQREAAEFRTTNVPGVAGIDNAITLPQTPDARDAREAISAAFRRVAALEANGLRVDISADGLVILSGHGPLLDRTRSALAAAWSAPSVTRVEDRICVESRP
jgi:osmotically-inducible protein OsmY